MSESYGLLQPEHPPPRGILGDHTTKQGSQDARGSNNKSDYHSNILLLCIWRHFGEYNDGKAVEACVVKKLEHETDSGEI